MKTIIQCRGKGKVDVSLSKAIILGIENRSSASVQDKRAGEALG